MSLTAAALSLWLGASVPCSARDGFAPFRGADACEDARVRAEKKLGFPLEASPETSAGGDCAAIATELDARCELSQLPRAKPQPDAKARVDALFQRPEFAEARAPEAGRLAQLFARFLSWLFQAGESRSAQHYAFATRYAVLAVAGALALWALLRAARRRRHVAQVRTRSSSDSARLQLEPPPEHLQRARALLRSEPRASMRESLLALLSLLESQNWARPDRVTTNRELADMLGPRGMPEPLRARALPLLTAYDPAYYSLEPVESERAETFLNEVVRLEADIERRA